MQALGGLSVYRNWKGGVALFDQDLSSCVLCAINNTDVCPNHLCVCGSLNVHFSSSCVTVKFRHDIVAFVGSNFIICPNLLLFAVWRNQSQ